MLGEKEKKIVKLGLFVAVLYLAVQYLPQILGGVDLVYQAAAPLVTGCIIAFILNILLRRVESIYFPKSQSVWVKRTRRPVGIVVSLAILVLIILLLAEIVVPELVASFRLIGQEIPPIVEQIRLWIMEHSDQIPTVQEALTNLEVDWPNLFKNLATYVVAGAGGFLNSAVAVVGSVVGSVTQFVIGFIFAIYLLSQKEKLQRQFRRLFAVYLKPSWNQKLEYVLHTAYTTFSNFIAGQCTEAVILGLLCTVGMWILRFPYAAMTGAVVGVTALIPIVGAYIGAAVGAFMIFTQDPLKALFFLIFLVVLQQLEGNLIYPRVVGSSVGLPGIWVLAAVTVGGGAMGILGMLLAVPLAATVYQLLGRSVNRKWNLQHPQEQQDYQEVKATKPAYRKRNRS